MAATGEALVQAASALLAQQAQEQLSFEGDSDEFGQRLCDSMAEFGSTHLHCLPTHQNKILFLQQVSLLLASHCLPTFCHIHTTSCVRLHAVVICHAARNCLSD